MNPSITATRDIVIAVGNAKFFPEDNQWQRHCEKVLAFLNAQRIVGKVQ